MAAAQTNFGVSKCLTEVKIVNPCNRLELSQTRPLQTLTSRYSQRKHFATMRVHQPSDIFAGPVASIPDYGLPNYGISRVLSPTQPKPSESSENGESPLVTQFWDYGTPRPYNTPSSYVTPGHYTTPKAYGPSPGGTDGAVPPGGGGGGGWGGGGEGGGESEPQPGDDPIKKKLSPSQIITLVYAALVLGGGLMGYVKKGSAKSGAAGLFTGAALLAVFYLLPTAPLPASILGLAISATLLSIMGSRFASSKKMMPSGMVALISLVMTGGYIHGIVRTH